MRVLFVTTSLYPDENAMAQRVHLFAKICTELNHEVYILSNGKTGYLEEKEYDGIKYRSLKVNGKTIVEKYLGLRFYHRRLAKYLSNMEKPDVIFVSDMYNNALIKIKKYCEKNQVKLISDCVEWFSPEEYKNGKKNREYLENQIQNTELLDKSLNVVCISKFLLNYYQKKGINSIRIPVLCDSSIKIGERSNNGTVRFVYAGNPGLKDNLNIVFQAILKLQDDIRKKCRFDFIGINETDAANDSRIKEICRFHGRLSHSETIEILKKADFSFLFRNPDAVYAKAGFPTKSIESINYGLPIIMNYSSDLRLYFTDGKDCLIVNAVSAEEVAGKIAQAVSMPDDERTFMQKCAKETAVKFFDYHNYIKEFEQFLNTLE